MLFNTDWLGVERALDGLSMRFQATAHNLANIHTPGYQRQLVNFEDSLKEAIALAQPTVNPEAPLDVASPDPTEFLDAWFPSVTRSEKGPQRIDGNGSSLEQEMGEISKTALKFNLLSTWVASEYRNLKFVIDAR
ncbi:MAG: flagellar basal body rod protein FlgB [Cyanobacteria bacterium NC_groundwater_1444_Ag_S-0.65um_54_12]|nr:flagellar basal body rod protein FlgB [Cyanobacteria bacterium NC_groundwater_1444_Ag_S-0.65um_54_12]